MGTIAVGDRPNSIAVVHAASGTKIYVANSGNHSVTVVDANTLSTATIPVGVTTASDAPQGPYFNLAANQTTGKVYVANADEGTVTVINPDNTTVTIDLGGPSAASPFAVAINAATNTIYVADPAYRKLWIIDGSSNHVSSVVAGGGARSVAVNSTTNRLYVANEADGTVTIYDAGTHALSTVNVGHSPWKVAVDETTNQVFVANALDNTLTVLNGANPTTLSSFNVGSDPVDIALDATTGSAYLADFQNGGITSVSPGQSSLTSLATGSKPLALQFDPANSRLYVLDSGDAELAIVNPVTGDVLCVPTGALPVALAIDAQGQRVYVVNQADNTLSVYDLSVQLAKTTTTLSSPNQWVLPGGSTTLNARVTSQSGTPTGSMLFYDAAHQISSAAVAVGADGSASFTATNLSDLGGYSFVAHYLGDSHFAPSHSAPMTLQVVRDATNTSLVAQPASAVVGQTIRLTAGVSATGSHPLTGSVTFYELVNNRQDLLASVALVNGSASFQTSSLSASSHTFIATYSGDTYNDISTSEPVLVAITAGTTTATTTTLSASPNPASTGSAVLFTAFVSSTGTHLPSGTMTFLDGMVVLGQMALSANASASLSVNTLATGSHAITASYSGDTYNAPSVSAALNETVNPLLSTTTVHLSSNPNPASQGASVTFTATVSTGGTHTPGGSVAFADGSVPLSTTALNASGMATYTTASLSVGTHSITAAYAGDSYNSGSTSSAVSQVITAPTNPAPSLATLRPNAATAGGSAFTLAVIGSNFVAGSTVLWNGETRSTTYIDANDLTAAIYAGDVANAGSVSITVANPTPGGGVSNLLTFTINPVAPVASTPSITALSPGIVKSSSGAFVLTVEGTYDSGATVLWGGSARTTSAASNGLQASIQAEDIANVGVIDVAIQNPNGTVSPAVKFVIDTKQGSIGAFTVTSNSSALSLAAGSTATLPVTFTDLNSSATMKAQCVNLPANASCSYSSGTLTLNSAASTPAGSYPVAVIFTATQSLSTSSTSRMASLALIALPLCGLCFSRCKRTQFWLAIGTLLLLLSFAGCGGGSQTVNLPVSPTSVTTTTQSSIAINLTMY